MDYNELGAYKVLNNGTVTYVAIVKPEMILGNGA